jgi:hypothetical protein
MLSKILAVIVLVLSAGAWIVTVLCTILQMICWMCTLLPVAIAHFGMWVCRKDMPDPGEDSLLKRTMYDNLYTVSELYSDLKGKWFRLLDLLGRRR